MNTSNSSSIIIPIQPVPIWTGSGTQNAVGFLVTSVSYDNTGVATGFYQLLDVAKAVILSSSVMATPAQTAAWTDDAIFYAVLATNAGLTVL